MVKPLVVIAAILVASVLIVPTVTAAAPAYAPASVLVS
jgi:hypothetical protein